MLIRIDAVSRLIGPIQLDRQFDSRINRRICLGQGQAPLRQCLVGRRFAESSIDGGDDAHELDLKSRLMLEVLFDAL